MPTFYMAPFPSSSLHPGPQIVAHAAGCFSELSLMINQNLNPQTQEWAYFGCFPFASLLHTSAMILPW